MLIIQKQHIIYYNLGEEVRKISGNITKIKEYIINNYPIIIEKNTFFNHYPMGGIEKEKNIKIIDTHRKKIFDISKEIVQKLGIKKIIYILFGIEKTLYTQNQTKITLWGNIVDLKFRKKCIKSIKDLFKEAIFIYEYKKNIYHEFYSKYSYELSSQKNHLMGNTNKGIDRDIKIAKAKAISEAIERISGSIYPEKMERYNTKYHIIHSPYIDQKDFEYNKEKGSYCITKDVFGNTKYLCPGEILFYPYSGIFQSRKGNSNGMSTHTTLCNAIKGGIYELIERDTFILMRLLKSGIHQINKKSLSKSLQQEIEKFEKDDSKIYVFVIKIDNPLPVCLIYYEKQNQALFGLGIDNDLEKAIYKGLQEINVDNLKINKKNTQEDLVFYHIRYYLQKKNHKNIQWLLELSKVKKQTIVDMFGKNLSLENVYAYYEKLGIKFSYYQYKSTVNEVYKRKTVRVVSEQLLPIRFGEGIPKTILQSNRLKQQQKNKKINFDIHPLG